VQFDRLLQQVANVAAAAYFSQTADFFGDAAKEYARGRFLH